MLDAIRVKPGSKPHIAKRDPRDTLGLENKEHAAKRLDELRGQLEKLQGRLSAEGWIIRMAVWGTYHKSG